MMLKNMVVLGCIVMITDVRVLLELQIFTSMSFHDLSKICPEAKTFLLYDINQFGNLPRLLHGFSRVDLQHNVHPRADFSSKFKGSFCDSALNAVLSCPTFGGYDF